MRCVRHERDGMRSRFSGAAHRRGRLHTGHRQQVLPESRAPTGNAAANAPKPESTAGNVGRQAGSTSPSLPAKPDDLVTQGWKETTHPGEAVNGRRVFINPKTGQTIEFDKGRSGEPGWRGQDHYHVRNPNATGRNDKYLDREGHPVPNGSKRSHIPPEIGETNGSD